MGKERRELSVESLETIDDIKEILRLLHIRIDTDNPEFERVKQYFMVDIVPKGYFKLMDFCGVDKSEYLLVLDYEDLEKECQRFTENQNEYFYENWIPKGYIRIMKHFRNTDNADIFRNKLSYEELKIECDKFLENPMKYEYIKN